MTDLILLCEDIKRNKHDLGYKNYHKEFNESLLKFFYLLHSKM